MDSFSLSGIEEQLSLSSIDSKIKEVLENKYVSTLIIMFIALYAGLAAPKLPKYWVNLFDSQLFKLFVLFMIGYMATKNYSIAIVCAMAFLITMNTMQKHKVNDKIISILIMDPTNYDTSAKLPIPSDINNIVLPNSSQYMELPINISSNLSNVVSQSEKPNNEQISGASTFEESRSTLGEDFSKRKFSPSGDSTSEESRSNLLSSSGKPNNEQMSRTEIERNLSIAPSLKKRNGPESGSESEHIITSPGLLGEVAHNNLSNIEGFQNDMSYSLF